MRIISIRKKDDENVTIQFDDSKQLILSSDTFFKSGLRKGDEISEDRFAVLIENNITYHIKKRALSYLARRAHTERELLLKLKSKAYDEKLIKLVLKELRDQSFLDDKEFAAQFLEEKSTKKKWGKLKIKSALLSKGVNQKIIEELLSGANLEEFEMQQAKELASKKYILLQKKETDRKKLVQKLIAFLISRGYKYETSAAAVRKIIEPDSDDF